MNAKMAAYKKYGHGSKVGQLSEHWASGILLENARSSGSGKGFQ